MFQANQECQGCELWELRAVQWVLDTGLGEGRKVAPGVIVFSCLADLLASYVMTLGWKGAEARLRGGALFLRGALPPSQGWLFLSQMWLQRGLG